MTSRYTISLLCLLLCSVLVQAEPQFSSISGQSCFLCHSNPTGRAMRSLYGSQFFGPTYLSYKQMKPEILKRVNPSLSEAVTIGADLRTIFLSQNSQDKSVHTGLSAPLSTNTGSISQMEGYIYLLLQPTDQYSIYWSQGVASSHGHFEVYGMANVLPFHGYVKAGQFQESFGWGFTDHTSFVRTGLLTGYDGSPTNFNDATSIPNPPDYGVGGEIGFRPWKFDISASFTTEQNTIPTGYDTQKRWFARAMFQQGINALHLQLTVGGSWFHAPRKAADPLFPYVLPETKRNEAWGAFAGLGWQGFEERLGCHNGFGFLASNLMFEYDRRAHWQITSNTDGMAVTSAYSTVQLSTQLQPGLWLTGAYDWLDNGYELLASTDSTRLGSQAKRTTLGVQFFPIPWLEIAPRYRLTSGPMSFRNQKQVELQLHFFF